MQPNLTAADPRLKQLAGQADQLLGGGKPAFQSRIDSLRGLPVVVNKWASWCGPCRAEAPVLQKSAKQLGNRIAFLGVNVSDTSSGSADFRRLYPMPFPSYADPQYKISSLLPPADRPPVTAIYDARGKLVHLEIGAYQNEAQLRADLERYAGPIKPQSDD